MNDKNKTKIFDYISSKNFDMYIDEDKIPFVDEILKMIYELENEVSA